VIGVPEQTSRITVSGHVTGRRWFQRSDDPVMDPADAWADATPIRGHGLDGDEVRYHEYTETVLVCCNDTLTTVIDAETAQSRIRAAVALARGDQA
jgi:hypothetical protein